MITRLFIKYYLIESSERVYHIDELDLYDDIGIPLNLQVCNISKISEKNTSSSLNFNIPATEKNLKVLKNATIAGISTDSYGEQIYLRMLDNISCIIYQNDIEVLSGILNINDIIYSNGTPLEYKCTVYSGVVNFLDVLSSSDFYGGVLYRIMDHRYSIKPSSISIFGDMCSGAPFTSEAGYCKIDWFNKLSKDKVDWKGFEVTPYVSLPRLLNWVITDAGYKWESKFFRHHVETVPDINWNMTELLPEEYRYPNCSNPYLYNGFDSYPNNHIFNPQNLIIPATNNPMGVSYDSVGITNSDFGRAETKLYNTSEDNYFNFPWTVSMPVTDFTNINKTFTNLVDYSSSTLYFDTTSDINIQGWPLSGNDLENFTFTAPTEGWYKLKYNFKWTCTANTSLKDGTGGNGRVVYNSIGWEGSDNWDDLSDAEAYRIRFGISVNGGLKEIFYVNSANCEAFARFHTGKKRRIKRASDNYSVLVASSDEFDEHNSTTNNQKNTVVSTGSNGWTYNKPCEYETIIYLYQGDRVGLYSNIFLRQYFNYENGAKWCMHDSLQRDIVWSAGVINIKQNDDEPIFSTSLIDRVGKNRKINWGAFFNQDYTNEQFIKDLCRIFNLYIEDVSGKPRYDIGHTNEFYPDKTLYIDPRDFYYVQENLNVPYRWDFDDYIDFKTIKAYRPSDYVNKEILFELGQSSSSEALLNEYNSSNTVKYGGGQKTNGSNSSSETISSILGTSICACDYDGQICPRVFLSDKENNSITPKIFFGQEAYSDIALTDNYFSSLCVPNNYDGIASRTGSSEGPETMKAALEFGWQNKYYPPYNLKRGSDFMVPSNDLYNTFYASMVNELIGPDSRIIEAEAYIPADTIRKLRMNDIVKYESITWYIISINSWLDENTPCKITLMKKNNYSDSVKSNRNVKMQLYNQMSKWY